MQSSLPRHPNPPDRIEPPSRILIIGTTGAGKTTLARAIAAATTCTHIELDRLYWDRDWTPFPNEVLIQKTREASALDRWVADGNFSKLRPILWNRADTIVWLNTSPVQAFPQLFVRTLRRAVLREPLWNGNVESFRKSFFSKNSILVWYLRTYAKIQRTYTDPETFDTFPHLCRVTISSRAEADLFVQWLAKEHARAF